MSTDSWVDTDIALDKPNPARIYDYFLGGYHNFEADRVVADKMLAIIPEIRQETHLSRECMRRYINFLVEQGLDQFLDIGSGLPTLGNAHELAQAANPAARVVYVDIDPVAVAHGQALLQGAPYVAYIWGDIRQPAQILNHKEVQQWLNLSRPVAMVLSSTLAYVPDDEEAANIVGALRQAMAPGSYLVIVHASFHGCPPDLVARISRLYANSAAANKVRAYAEILRFFEGFELVEPGLVNIPFWRSERQAEELLHLLGLVGVGRLAAPRIGGQAGKVKATI